MCFYMVAPPQMPVPLKYMYNADILRDEFTTFAPRYPLIRHTIRKSQLSFLKQITKYSYDHSQIPQMLLTHCIHTKQTVILPHITHKEKNV